MAVFRLRGLVPRRPALRILLLLVVAVVAIVVAAVVFSGPPTATEPSVVAAGVSDSTTTEGTVGGGEPQPVPAASPESAGATSGTVESPSPQPDTVESPSPQPDTVESPSPQPDTVESPSPQPDTVESPSPQPDTVESPSPRPDTGIAVAASPVAPANTPPSAAVASAPSAAPTGAGGPPDPGGTAQLIEQLRPLVAEPDPNVPDYDRDHFAGWLDSDGDCVNSRHEILQVEAVDFSMNAEGCAVASGEWFDPYTDRTYTNPRDLDVDHVVALADAWVSGAWAWADELLDRFSNDFGNLNAIQSGENRSKSAKGPADYTPSASGARCEYLVQYATVKIRWQLSIAPDDFAAVQRGLGSCNVSGATGDVTPVAPVRTGPPTPATTTTAMAAAPGCHPDYEPCLPNLSGDALNCGDLTREQKPVTVKVPGTDPYRFDRDGDGRGCTS